MHLSSQSVPFRTFSSSQEETLHHHHPLSLHPFSASGNHSFTSVLIDCFFLYIAYKWNHTHAVLCDFISFTYHNVFKVHPCSMHQDFIYFCQRIIASSFFKKIFFFLTAPGLTCVMWDLVPLPGIERGPPILGGSLSHWTTRKVPCIFVF